MGDHILLKLLRSVRDAGRRYVWKRKRKQQIRDYLGSQQIPRLQVGAGPNVLPNWLNSDISPINDQVVYLDASDCFPFPDKTFRYVFSEHVIEHLPSEVGERMIKECFRVLMPGGKLRIATPDLDKIAGLVCPNLDENAVHYVRWFMSKYRPEVGSHCPCYVINDFMRLWGHQFIYSRKTLSDVLKSLGFVEIRSFLPGESDDPLLHGIEGHGRHVGDKINAFETMVLEATRHSV
jgi:predicted SAM-dependent methyltransferase